MLTFTRLSLTSLCLLLLFLALVSYAHSQTGPLLSVTGNASPAYPGQETTYHLQLLNHTGHIVYNGVLSITLPVGFTYVPSSTQIMGHGWPMANAEPQIQGQTLTWGPYHLPAAGVTAHNPYGIHTLLYCDQAGPALHLEGAKPLVGSGGYVTQLFYAITTTTTAPSPCAVNFVQEAYARNLIPIIRLGGVSVNGIWQAPDPGPQGDYAEIAGAVANFVAGLPRRDTNPLYIQVWNEPDLWIEWSNRPNAAEYGRFFVAVSRAIRRLGDARIRIVNGALTPGNPAFLEGLLQVPGFRDAFDVWSSHCYPYNHPPQYNTHNGTARYRTYAIDCYLSELAIIQRYGRSGVKVMVTETGYELGNRTFGFEGFPSINETNRAQYISAAFSLYWQHWPEVVAVTPFQLVDSTGHWQKFDWLYPAPPYLHHPQYDSVALLPKPAGQIQPYGYQVTFQARVGEAVPPGLYPSRLSGSNSQGHTASATSAAPVRVYPAGSLTSIYLPMLKKPLPREGPWYQAEAAAPSPGAIVPSHFLRPDSSKIIAAPLTSELLRLSGEPATLELHEAAGLGVVGLREGWLAVIDLARWRVLKTVELGQEPQGLVAGGAEPAMVYVNLSDRLALVDLERGVILRQRSGLGRLRGMAWDEATGRLFAVDAAGERLLLFRDDLSGPPAELKLAHQPNGLALDPKSRHLYLSFPAVSEVIAIEADTLKITAQASLPGGPILALALAGETRRLYVLSALAPRHRGLAVWQTPDLQPLALAAGSAAFPLDTATTLAPTPSGQLLLAERDGLWWVRPDDFTAQVVSPPETVASARGIKVDQKGRIYLLEADSSLHKID